MPETERAAVVRSALRLAGIVAWYKYLVQNGYTARNPLGKSSGRRSIATKARHWSFQGCRHANCSTHRRAVAGLRGRATLSIGLPVGLRRAQIAALKLGELHQKRGYDL